MACFRGSGLKLINSWYNERASSEQDERARIVQAAATIICEDIRTTAYNTTDYPDLTNFTEESKNLVPQTLALFLKTVIVKNKKGKTDGLQRKCTAIAHTIISATRPRSFMSPILLGLGVHLFRKVASRNIVQAVSNLGVCSSHKDISIFEESAVKYWKPEIDANAFSQFVFDYADFNINTMTGKGTFHAMGGIHCVTPYKAVGQQEITKSTKFTLSNEIANTRKIELQTFHRTGAGVEGITVKNVYCEEASTLK